MKLWRIFIVSRTRSHITEKWVVTSRGLQKLVHFECKCIWSRQDAPVFDAHRPCFCFQTRSHLQVEWTHHSQSQTPRSPRVMSYHRSCFWWSDLPWLDARCVCLLFQLDSGFTCSRASSPTTLFRRDDKWCFSGESRPSGTSSMQSSSSRRQPTDSSAPARLLPPVRATALTLELT